MSSPSTATSSRARAGVAWRPPSRARVARLRERLREVYGVPLMRPHGHPIAELVLTVLSQSTNDRNRDVAYLRLRGRLPSWEAVRDAPLAQVEEAILVLERLAAGRGRRRGRPPAWMSAVKRRGRPPGSKNKAKEG